MQVSIQGDVLAFAGLKNDFVSIVTNMARSAQFGVNYCRNKNTIFPGNIHLEITAGA